MLLALLLLAPSSGDEILKLALERERQQVELRAQYLYHEHMEVNDADKSGGPGKIRTSRDWEVIFLEGSPYRKLVRMNGKALNAKQLQEEERKIQMTAAQRRAEKAKGGKKGIRVGEAGLRDLLRLMDNVLLREEEIGGRKAWVVQSEAKKGLGPDDPRDARILCYRYTTWIDQEDRVIARSDFEVVREGVDAKPGTKSTALFAKENGSPWFCRSVVGEFFHRGHWFQQLRFSDFKKFDAQSEIKFEKEHD